MKNWSRSCIHSEYSILETLKIIDDSSLQIALVTDEKGKLLGTATDGDIRRAILNKVCLDDPIGAIMNQNPTVATEKEEKYKIMSKIRGKNLRHVPVVDDQGLLKGLICLDDLVSVGKIDYPVVLMVGGLGSRLYPLTESCPKPLLRIGKKPLLETILESFIEYGFYQFYFAVNYKAEMIREYFGDGSSFGVHIQYLHESKRMGTAGALSLLGNPLDTPFVVMNGDLLTKVNFKQMLDFHQEHQAKVTMAVREYVSQVPYGVVRLDSGHVANLIEKPMQSHFVNAGIYILSPEALRQIPSDTFFDMPELINAVIQEKKKVAAFPIREYWLDIGRISDFQKAQGEYPEVFGDD